MAAPQEVHTSQFDILAANNQLLRMYLENLNMHPEKLAAYWANLTPNQQREIDRALDIGVEEGKIELNTPHVLNGAARLQPSGANRRDADQPVRPKVSSEYHPLQSRDDTDTLFKAFTEGQNFISFSILNPQGGTLFSDSTLEQLRKFISNTLNSFDRLETKQNKPRPDFYFKHNGERIDLFILRSDDVQPEFLGSIVGVSDTMPEQEQTRPNAAVQNPEAAQPEKQKQKLAYPLDTDDDVDALGSKLASSKKFDATLGYAIVDASGVRHEEPNLAAALQAIKAEIARIHTSDASQISWQMHEGGILVFQNNTELFRLRGSKRKEKVPDTEVPVAEPEVQAEPEVVEPEHQMLDNQIVFSRAELMQTIDIALSEERIGKGNVIYLYLEGEAPKRYTTKAQAAASIALSFEPQFDMLDQELRKRKIADYAGELVQFDHEKGDQIIGLYSGKVPGKNDLTRFEIRIHTEPMKAKKAKETEVPRNLEQQPLTNDIIKQMLKSMGDAVIIYKDEQDKPYDISAADVETQLRRSLAGEGMIVQNADTYTITTTLTRPRQPTNVWEKMQLRKPTETITSTYQFTIDRTRTWRQLKDEQATRAHEKVLSVTRGRESPYIKDIAHDLLVDAEMVVSQYRSELDETRAQLKQPHTSLETKRLTQRIEELETLLKNPDPIQLDALLEAYKNRRAFVLNSEAVDNLDNVQYFAQVWGMDVRVTAHWNEKVRSEARASLTKNPAEILTQALRLAVEKKIADHWAQQQTESLGIIALSAWRSVPSLKAEFSDPTDTRKRTWFRQPKPLFPGVEIVRMINERFDTLLPDKNAPLQPALLLKKTRALKQAGTDAYSNEISSADAYEASKQLHELYESILSYANDRIKTCREQTFLERGRYFNRSFMRLADGIGQLTEQDLSGQNGSTILVILHDQIGKDYDRLERITDRKGNTSFKNESAAQDLEALLTYYDAILDLQEKSVHSMVPAEVTDAHIRAAITRINATLLTSPTVVINVVSEARHIADTEMERDHADALRQLSEIKTHLSTDFHIELSDEDLMNISMAVLQSRLMLVEDLNTEVSEIQKILAADKETRSAALLFPEAPFVEIKPLQSDPKKLPELLKLANDDAEFNDYIARSHKWNRGPKPGRYQAPYTVR